jgi:hypothetical protein
VPKTDPKYRRVNFVSRVEDHRMQRCLAIAIGVVFVATTSCLRSTNHHPAPPRPLLTTPASFTRSDDLPNNNGLCQVCHLDFENDPITTDHLIKGITCAHCHGRSIAHMHDETMMTSPDILYGRTEVEAMCEYCHRSHKDPKVVEIFRRKWLGRKRENGRSITADSTCTDCHGLHTISRR